MEKNNSKKFKINVVVPIVIILVFVFSLAGTLAWLTSIKNFNTNTFVGSLGLEIYYNNEVVSGVLNEDNNTYQAGKDIVVSNLTQGVNTPINLKFKNTGTISGLVRVTFNMFQKVDANGFTQNILIKKNEANVSFNNYVAQYADSSLQDVYGHYYLYNSVVNANETVDIVTGITPNASFTNNTVYIEVVCEIIAYSGNAYLVNDAVKPFGEVPAEWTAWK